ncbi:MAG: hypothetical protein AAFX01_13270 [Cyanobacteria bacterium J06638_28]
MANIANMTLEDLKALIAEVVNEQMSRWQSSESDHRTADQVLATMDKLRWTPPVGSPSTIDLLREDRDR